MKTISLLICFIVLAQPVYCQTAGNRRTSGKYTIAMDIAHGQRFWTDPSTVTDPEFLERIRYMTGELEKTAASVNADLEYLRGEIRPEDLSTADLLFIHIPSARFIAAEVKAITGFLENGGSMFLVMDGDHWSTLDQTNVNDLIQPFDIRFGTESPDTLSGGYTLRGAVTPEPLKVTCHGMRLVQGGTPFCFSIQSEENPFGVYAELAKGGRLIVMGDGMASLYMTRWNDVNDYQCQEFMQDSFRWLLNK